MPKTIFCKAMLRLQYLRLEAELLEALSRVVEDQLVQKGLSRRRAEEGVVALLGDIDTDHQMLFDPRISRFS